MRSHFPQQMENRAKEQFHSINNAKATLLQNSMKLQQMNSCLACGNCLAGCPDAKNSTDKNYIISAVQANFLLHLLYSGAGKLFICILN